MTARRLSFGAAAAVAAAAALAPAAAAAQVAPQIAAPIAAQPAAAAAPRSDRYIGIILGSDHIGGAHLNNVNPGLTYGIRRPLAAPRLYWFAEGGVFYNSYKEVAPLALIGVHYDLGRLGPAEWGLGAATGTAYYRELSRSLKRDYGIPNLAGFIPMLALTLTARVGQVEYRLTTVPAGQNLKAIFNFSVAVHF